MKALKRSPERFTDVEWDGAVAAKSFRVQIAVDSWDRPRLLEDVARTFAEHGANIVTLRRRRRGSAGEEPLHGRGRRPEEPAHAADGAAQSRSRLRRVSRHAVLSLERSLERVIAAMASRGNSIEGWRVRSRSPTTSGRGSGGWPPARSVGRGPGGRSAPSRSRSLERGDPLAKRVGHRHGRALVERDADERRGRRRHQQVAAVVVDPVGGVVVGDARRADPRDAHEHLEQVVEPSGGVVLDGRRAHREVDVAERRRARGGGGTRSARGRSTACSGRSRRRPARRSRRSRRACKPRTETAASASVSCPSSITRRS